MRRVRHILFHGLLVVSAMLFVATCVLWVRSLNAAEHFAYAPAGSYSAYVVRSSRGVIYLDHRTHWDYERGWSHGHGRNAFFALQFFGTTTGQPVHGFGAFAGSVYIWPGNLYPGVNPPSNLSDVRYLRDDYRAISFPHWLPAVLFMAMTVLAGRHAWAAVSLARRLRAGHCPSCGYDLRATPDRCPECGNPLSDPS